MKEIQLTRGQVALVDDLYFESLNTHKWYAQKDINTFYAQRDVRVDGNRKYVRIHQVIMGNKWIDHIDGNGLNNQRSNLRLCTNSENQMNRRKSKNKTSTYKGVYLYKRTGKWKSHIKINGNPTHIGYFDSEVEAAKAYNLKAIELFGEFANLNIF